jgi:hypothetical protein
MPLCQRDLVDKIIVARIPALNKENTVLVRLHKVEMSGIWVESKTFNHEMLEKYEGPGLDHHSRSLHSVQRN